MGGKRRLKGGAPRLLGCHRGAEGVQYGRIYAALEAQHGPFTESLRFEAGRLAIARLQYENATRELSTAQRERRVGRGRRPNALSIDRLARRQGRTDRHYSRALQRFQTMVKMESPRGKQTLSELILARTR